MIPKIKICGIRRMEDVEACNLYMPDYAGFMFWEGSKRYIEPEKARLIAPKLDKRIRTVGVFVNSPIVDVAKIVSSGIIDIVQLHGHESDDYIRAVRFMTQIPVIKAFSVIKGDKVVDINDSPADMVLIDSGSGGTGEAFDWSFLEGIKREFFLAGGLEPDNARTALSTGAYALDVSSGVETEGYKDADKIRRFIEAVRGTKE